MLASIPTDSTEPIMTLERIPEDKPDFRPHPKSMPSGRSRPM
jgi:hypothetical protein